MREKQAVTREYAKRYRKAGGKEKSKPLNDFTALTGCNRKYAVRVFRAAAVKRNVIRKRRPANRKGKRSYTDDVIDCLRLIWEFFQGSPDPVSYLRVGSGVRLSRSPAGRGAAFGTVC
jgi:hypothetical protein